MGKENTEIQQVMSQGLGEPAPRTVRRLRALGVTGVLFISAACSSSDEPSGISAEGRSPDPAIAQYQSRWGTVAPSKRAETSTSGSLLVSLPEQAKVDLQGLYPAINPFERNTRLATAYVNEDGVSRMDFLFYSASYPLFEQVAWETSGKIRKFAVALSQMPADELGFSVQLQEDITRGYFVSVGPNDILPSETIVTGPVARWETIESPGNNALLTSIRTPDLWQGPGDLTDFLNEALIASDMHRTMNFSHSDGTPMTFEESDKLVRGLAAAAIDLQAGHDFDAHLATRGVNGVSQATYAQIPELNHPFVVGETVKGILNDAGPQREENKNDAVQPEISATEPASTNRSPILDHS